MGEQLERVIATGSRPNNIVCADGFSVSVIAGEGLYCTPRPDRYYREDGFNLGNVSGDYSGPYTHVEVGFPTARPEPWDQWRGYRDGPEDGPTDSVYAYVPVALVRALIESHGGEA